MNRVVWAFVFAFLVVSAAAARDPVPVYGPARVAVDDSDLLSTTILDVGTLAVTPQQPWKVYIGDGLTTGGIPIHPDGCVTNFAQVANATTNLNMHSYHISFGPWKMSGDAGEFDVTWGGSETWMRFVRDTGEAYLSYDFTIGENDTYTFEFAWTDGDALPTLQVCTNLLEGYATAPTNSTVYTRPDVSHVQIVYTAPADADFLFFRVFADTRMSTGIYFSEPVVAEKGLTVGTNGITMGANTWTELPDVDGKIEAATNALADDILAVSNRVAALEAYHEWPDTCCLFWPSNYVQSNTVSGIIDLPTNFPTHRLNLVVNDEDLESLTLNLPYWNPGRCVEIELHPIRLNNTPRSTKIAVNGVTVWDAVPFAAYNNWRYVVLSFDPVGGIWQADALATFRRAFYFDGTSRLDFPTNWPATVDDWKNAMTNLPTRSAIPLVRTAKMLQGVLVDEDRTEEKARTEEEASR